MSDYNNCSSSFNLIPFDDSGLRRTEQQRLNVSVIVSGGYDTSAIDAYRQGVEIRTNRHRFIGMAPKIGAGNLCHSLDVTTYGQPISSVEEDQSIVFIDHSDYLSTLINVETSGTLVEGNSNPDIFNLDSDPSYWFTLNGTLDDYEETITLVQSGSDDITYSEGPVPGMQAVSFEGVEGQSIPYSEDPVFRITGSFSVEFLFKSTTELSSEEYFNLVTCEVFQGIGSPDFNILYAFSLYQNSVEFIHGVIGDNAYLYYEADPLNFVDTWHHVAATRNSTTKEINFYFDGVLVQSTSYGNDPTSDGTEILAIGSNSTFSSYDSYQGNVSSLRFFDRVLSNEEIANEYALYSEYGGTTEFVEISNAQLTINYPVKLNGEYSLNEATLEPLTIPFLKPTNESVKYMAHSPKASLEDGNEDNGLGGGNSRIEQFVEFGNSTNYFLDEGQEHVFEGGMELKPGFSFIGTKPTMPFTDLGEHKIIDQIQTTDSDFINAIQDLDINLDEDIRKITNIKSMPAGFDIYGGDSAIYGTDSLAFRGKLRR